SRSINTLSSTCLCTSLTSIFTLSLHDALPIYGLLVQLAQLVAGFALPLRQAGQCLAEQILEFGNIGVVALALGLGQLYELGLLQDRKSTRLNSSHVEISYAVFCLKKKIATYLQ